MKIVYTTRETSKVIELGDKLIETISTKFPEYADELEGKTGLDIVKNANTKYPFMTCTFDENGYTIDIKEGFVVDVLEVYSNTIVKGLPLLVKIGQLIEPLVELVQDAANEFRFVIHKWTEKDKLDNITTNRKAEDNVVKTKEIEWTEELNMAKRNACSVKGDCTMSNCKYCVNCSLFYCAPF